MSQDKQMKAVSPLLQQVINISSIVGGVGTLIFCIYESPYPPFNKLILVGLKPVRISR